jgi:hypothetical protein
MSYFSAPYFSPAYFEVAGVPVPSPLGPSGPLGPSSFYFCDDYFSPTYFEAGPCAPPVSALGRHVRGRRITPEPVPDDQVPFILLALEDD